MASINFRLWEDEGGATAAEYALMLFMVAAVTVAATTTLRNQVVAVFNSAKSAFAG